MYSVLITFPSNFITIGYYNSIIVHVEWNQACAGLKLSSGKPSCSFLTTPCTLSEETPMVTAITQQCQNSWGVSYSYTAFAEDFGEGPTQNLLALATICSFIAYMRTHLFLASSYGQDKQPQNYDLRIRKPTQNNSPMA